LNGVHPGDGLLHQGRGAEGVGFGRSARLV
jgi:hypothetical protein